MELKRNIEQYHALHSIQDPLCWDYEFRISEIIKQLNKNGMTAEQIMEKLV